MNRKNIRNFVAFGIIIAIIYVVDLYTFRIINLSSGELKFELLKENSENSIMNFSFNVNTFLTILLLFTTIIYTYITKGILSDQHGPRLYAVGDVVDSEHTYDARVMEHFGFEDLIGDGFTYSTENYMWILSIKNNGDRPATKIKLKYEINLFRNEITFGIDRADVIDYHPILHKSVVQEIEIDYLPPGESIDKTIYYMENYPEANISIISLTSKENKYIKEKVIISKYTHSEFERLEDSHHLRQMLGIN